MNATETQATAAEHTQKLNAITLDYWFCYDPDTGVVSWRRKPNRKIRVGQQAGCRWSDGRNNYIRITVEGRGVFAHTVAFVKASGRMPIGILDHINGDGTDNRLINLREVDHTTNLRNQRRNVRNKSGVMGVDFHKAAGKWRSRIVVDQQEHHLGTFETQIEAEVARKAAERQYGFHENHGRPS